MFGSMIFDGGSVYLFFAHAMNVFDYSRRTLDTERIPTMPRGLEKVVFSPVSILCAAFIRCQFVRGVVYGVRRMLIRELRDGKGRQQQEVCRW
jgi:hypothetical protein